MDILPLLISKRSKTIGSFTHQSIFTECHIVCYMMKVAKLKKVLHLV